MYAPVCVYVSVCVHVCVCRLDRLQYLVDTRRDGGIDWRDALTMSDTDWHEMYTEYKEWWARRGR